MGAWGQKTVETLRVQLTSHELVRKAEDLARHLQETAQLEEQKAAQMRAIAEQLKERKLVQAALALDVATQSEARPVECFESPRFSELLVDIVRCDTTEIVRTRAMQPSERQAQLKLVDADDGDETPSRNH